MNDIALSQNQNNNSDNNKEKKHYFNFINKIALV